MVAGMAATGQQASCQHVVTFGRHANQCTTGAQACTLRVVPSKALGTHMGTPSAFRGEACDSSTTQTLDRTEGGGMAGQPEEHRQGP